MAESQACAWLDAKGYIIHAVRYQTPYGEIDILATKDHVLCAVEVKYRSTLERGLEAISLKQQTRIQNALLYVIANHPEWQGYDLRLDALVVSPLGYLHLENAWEDRGVDA
jgi:putative endonuclease